MYAADRVPEDFKERKSVLTSDAALVLPKQGPDNYATNLQERAVPQWGLIYALNEPELQELSK